MGIHQTLETGWKANFRRCIGERLIFGVALMLTGCLDLNPAHYAFEREPTVCAADCVAPAPTCRDAQTLLAYRVRACDATVCQREAVAVTCLNGCFSGACVGEPCAGIFCSTPPAAQCVGSLLRSFSVPGACDNAQCNYVPVDTFCSRGCENGHCVDEPCLGKVCNNPPPSECSGDSTLKVYVSTGTCGSDGACQYAFISTSCIGACRDGACVGDPCAGALCQSPPVPTCRSSTVVNTWEPHGTCVDGVCEYRSLDQSCAGTLQCVAGNCTEGGGSGGGQGHNGGGVGNTGGGVGSTGGGVGNTGGGVGNTGGGVGNTGGGVGNTGGGVGNTGDGGMSSGDTCADPMPIASGDTYVGSNFDLTLHDDYESKECGLKDQVDSVYKLSVPAGQRVRVFFTQAHGTLVDPQSCNGRFVRCLARAPDVSTGTVLSWHNLAAEQRDVLLIVEAYSLFPFSPMVSVSFDVPPPGDICTNSISLSLGTELLHQDTSGLVNDYNLYAKDRVWNVDIPPGHTLKAIVTPTTTEALSVAIARSPLACSIGPMTLAQSTHASAAVSSINNSTANTVPAYVVVASGATAPFSILATSSPIASGDICANALVLPFGSTSVSMEGLVADYSSVSPCIRTGRVDRLYHFTVPPHLRATVKTSIDAQPLLFPAQTDCTAILPACLAGTEATSASWINQTNTDKEVMAWVGTSRPDAGFDLTLSLTPVPAGDSCSDAIAITGSTSLGSQSLSGLAGDSNCGGPLSMRDLIYRLDVPAGRKATLTAVPDVGTLNIGMTQAIPEACSPTGTPCGPTSLASPYSVTHSNRSSAQESVYVVVKGSATTNAVTVTANYESESLAPPGDVCSTASVISTGTLPLQTMSSLSHDYDSALTAPDRVFAIDVPAGKKMSVKAISRDAGQLVGKVALYTGLPITCGWKSTLAASGNDSSTVTYTNLDSTSTRIFIVVHSTATFDLTTSFL